MQLTRRSLLAGAGAALYAAARKPLVAAHPYVYVQYRPDRDINPILDQVFADIKAAGMDAIELMQTQFAPEDSAVRIGELSRRHALPVMGMSYNAAMWNREQHPAILKEIATLLDRLGKVGGRTLGISVGSAGKRKTEAQFDAQADLLKRIRSLAADRGVTANLHNHTYEVANGEFDLKGTLARIPDFPLGPDLNWLLRGGVDPVDFIRRRGRQMVYMHLRDQTADGKWTEAMGEGAMDYTAIGRALREVGFSGDMAVELAHEKDIKPSRPLGEDFRLSRVSVRKTMGY
jgi:sugar phosphate isomerase/epimerase